VARESDDDEDHDMTVVRFMPDGTRDAGFGTDGVVHIEFRPDDRAFAMCIAVRPDGRIVVDGAADMDGRRNEFAVAQLLHNGSLGPTLIFDGLLCTHIEGIGAVMGQLLLRSVGSVVGPFIPVDRSFGDLMVMNDPGSEHITFSYTMERSEKLTCVLFDTQGRKVQLVCMGATRAVGPHQEVLRSV